MKHSAPSILIADDDPGTMHMLQALLQREGFQTLSAGTLAEARDVIATRAVSLILLDVNFPDGSGLDLCRSHSSQSSIPVLFISASEDLKTKMAGFEAGGVDYITKPLIGAEVLARVRTHLKLKAAYDELAELQAEKIRSLGTKQSMLMPLPSDLPDARFQVALRQTNQAGGDFYDVIPFESNLTDYVIADVCGHDIGSALWTASFKTLLGEYCTPVHSPLEVCRMLNNALRRILPAGAYFSVLYARINREDMRLTLVNAGHPPAVLQAPESGKLEVIEQTGDLLGIFADAVFDVQERALAVGDRVFLYTDGLIEQGRTRTEGLQQLSDVCRRTATESLDDAVFFGLASVCVPDVVDDDVLLMGIEV